MTWLPLLFLPAVYAHVLTPSYEEGKSRADAGKEQITQEMTSPSLQTFRKEVQGKGRNPKKSDLGAPQDSPINSFLLDVYGERQHFELDPAQDPLFAQRSDPLKQVDGDLGGESPASEYTIHLCTETKLQPVVACEIHKDVRLHRIQVRATKKGAYEFSGPGEQGIFKQVSRGKDSVRYWTDDEAQIKAFLYRKLGLNPEKISSLTTELKGRKGEKVEDPSNYKWYGYKPWGKRDWFFYAYKVHYSYEDTEERKTPQVLTINGCENVDALAEEGYYSLHSTSCLDEANPRVYEDVAVSQPCWREKRIYHATKTAQGDCDALKIRGCEQVRSQFNGRTYQQTFRCESGPGALIARALPGQRPFCLTGNCEDLTDLDDLDFDQAMAQMALLDELGKQAGHFHIFSGQSKSCKSTKFKKCCFKSSGIAVQTGISKCSSGEKELARRRGKGHCVYVGRKTIKKHRIKIGHRKVYCCFPSKLLRVFQEQGRQQLGMGWGKAKRPQCRGLQLGEIQRIDFALMDLSEAFDEIRERMADISLPKAQAQLKQRLQQMKGAVQ